MNRILTRRAFGLPADPWADVRIDTADAAAVGDMVEAAVGSGTGYDQAMVQIVGPTGAGKSTAVWSALSRAGLDLDADVIQVARLDRRRATIADVVSAIYRTLGQPRPTRGEDRDAQLRQVLGQAAATRRPGVGRRRLVLVLDNLHHVHHATRSALKDLRELAWLGRAPLLGVILLSQRDMLHACAEIRERSDTYLMTGPSAEDAEAAMAEVLGARIAADARAAIAARVSTWNRLIWDVDQALSLAQAAGHHCIEIDDALRAVGADLADLIRRSDRTQADIARMLGVSQTSVSRAVSGQRPDAALEERIRDVLLGDLRRDEQPAATPVLRAVSGGA